ncbi:MAG: S9 family peptidase [bacterium]
MQTESEKKAAKSGQDVQVVDKSFKQHVLYVQGTGSSESKGITGAMSVWEFEWSPDATQLVIQASATPRTDDSYMFKRLYLVSRVDTGAPKRLTETNGKLGAMAWSPEGKNIAYLAGVDSSDPTAGSIFIVPAAGGAAKNLSDKFEGTVTGVDWLNANTLIFSATERSHTTLNTIPAEGGSLTRILPSGYGLGGPASFTNDGKTFALSLHAYNHPNEVFVGDPATKKVTRLTNTNPDLDQMRFSGAKEIAWKARDGLEITGLLMLPHDFQTGKKYPCIVQVHGGHEFDDVIDGVDFLVQQGYVDPEAVGIGGFSYGGYFSAWAATRHTERFRAASMGAGIANWISFTGTSDIPYENSMVHWNLDVYKNMPLAWERSPMAHVEKSQTALLISHGDKDDRVPLGQGWEIYTALKLLGKTVEFDIYPREAHGFSERNHQLYSIRRNLEWFDKHVKSNANKTTLPN